MHALLAAAPLVVGLLLPPEEPEALAIRRGAEMAVAEAGPGFRLAVRGRKGAWGSDASETARLVEDDGALALVAPPGGAASHLALQIAGRTGVPVATLCSDSSVTGAAVPWAVRVTPSTHDEALADFSSTRAARWIAVVPAGRDGRQVALDLRRAAAGKAALSRVVAADEPADWRALLAEETPEGALLWLDPAAAARVAGALRAAGFGGLLAGPSRLDAASFRSAMSGEVVVPRLAGADAAFAARYRARYGAAPDATAALAHDAAALMIDVLRRSGAREARRLFPYTGSWPGATGALAFDRSGNRIVSLEPRRVAARAGAE